MDFKSDLEYIDVKSCNPFDLFNEWLRTVSGYSNFDKFTMCLATNSLEKEVSNRNIFVKEVTDNGFLFCTDGRGKKSQDIENNSKVAGTFLWTYTENDTKFVKQVRIVGLAKKLSPEVASKFWDQEYLFCKIRSYICKQSDKVNWDELKQRHDRLLQEVLDKKVELSKPEHYTVYEIVPDYFDFYSSKTACIGDRVVFSKNGEIWEYTHVAA